MRTILRHWNLVINAVSTLLTVITGIRENAIVLLFVGRFALVRSRLRLGGISYNVARLDTQSRGALPELKQVADAYDFHRAPTRTPGNLAEDRSVCLRTNSMTSSSLTLHFDDLFGTNARREQLFLFSISALHCDVLNLDAQWLQHQCIDYLSGGNQTSCHAYILTSFSTLQHHRRDIHASVPDEFGVAAAPFLRCRERPMEPFKYGTDLLVLQSFWGGGSYHVEIQSSVCWARPVAAVHSVTDGSLTLFQTVPADQEASVVMAVPPLHASIRFVSGVYAVITLTMVVRGVKALFTRHKDPVAYVPWSQRRQSPLARVVSAFQSIHVASAVRFSASGALVGSDLWMNHWQYIYISIVDSCVNVRTLYVVLEMGTWMVSKQVSLENFLFVCSALTRLTWLTCLAHTLLVQFFLGLIHVAHAASSNWKAPRGVALCGTLRWYVRAVALLCNFKLYSILLVLQLYALTLLNGSPTMMRHASPYKRPVYGGFADVAPLWRSEIVCDLSVVLVVQLLAGHAVASLLLLTRLRHAVGNSLLELLQRRYVFVGWDAFVAMHALGIDPFPPDAAAAVAHCSIAALTRQLHASGPSAWVRFAGDDALVARNSEGQDDDGGVPVAPASDSATTWARRVVHVKPSKVASQPPGDETSDVHAARRRSSAKRAETHTRVLTIRAETRWGPLELVAKDEALPDTRLDVATSHAADGNDQEEELATRDALHSLSRRELRALVTGSLKLTVA